MTLQEIRNNNIGKKFYNKHDEYCEIIEYIDCRNIRVRFNNGYIKTTGWSELNGGYFNNPYTKTVFGLGYIGEGEYFPVSRDTYKSTPEYNHWNGMMKRCYSENQLKIRPQYEDCTVCEEWHNFQNFAQWYNENLWNNKCTVLDKDILIKGNKVYSPKTCVLVNNELNVLFINSKKNRGCLPLGVTVYKENKYRSKCSAYGKVEHIGTYDTPEKAFYAYKEFKESHIRQVAENYKNKYDSFPKKLYEAMMNWKIEISD